jgi:glyoxylase-like metal-dependent hydrolase (beta-lactamase superfamily II)
MHAVQLIPIKLKLSNAYLLIGHDGVVLVDTGLASDVEAIEDELLVQNLSGADIKLILHTHGHADHVGGTASLVAKYQCTTALGAADLQQVLAGKNNRLKPTRLMGKWLIPFVDKPFTPFTPDWLLHENSSLASFGVDADILFTPGHTAGSLSILLADGRAVVGDVLMGGYMGGHFFPHLPNYHYFADDLAQVHASINKLVSAGVSSWYPGHGGPLTTKSVLKRFAHVIH